MVDIYHRLFRRRRDTLLDGVNVSALGLMAGVTWQLGVAAIVGVAPHACDSGTLKGKRMIRGGRASLRCVLYMGVRRAITGNPLFKTMYDCMLAKGKPYKVIAMAIVRKLVVMLNVMVRRNEMWRTPCPA